MTNLTIPQTVLSWLSTPFHLNAAIKGIGCDCYGLIRGVWQEWSGRQLPVSPRLGDSSWRAVRALWPDYLVHLQTFAREIPAGAALPGDVLLFSLNDDNPVHAGIAMDDGTFVHALGHGTATGVLRSRYAGVWQRRHHRSFRFAGI